MSPMQKGCCPTCAKPLEDVRPVSALEAESLRLRYEAERRLYRVRYPHAVRAPD